MTLDNYKKISIIIVNSNTKDILQLCLKNLVDIYPNFEVIVVDAASTDGSANMVKELFPWVILLEIENYGLAYGLNRGLEKASGEYILYLGSDAFPDKGKTLEGLVDYFETNTSAAAATVKLITRDGKMDMDCHRGIPTPWTSFCHFASLDRLFPKSRLFAEYFMTYKDLNTTHEIGMTIAHFLFVRKSLQDAVGKWDEDFFIYGEDVDMCYRIKQAGYKLMYLGELSAGHWKGASVGRKETGERISTKGMVSVKGKQITKRELYILLRRASIDGMRRFYLKHLVKKHPRWLNALVLFQMRIQEMYRVFYWNLKIAHIEKKENHDSRL